MSPGIGRLECALSVASSRSPRSNRKRPAAAIMAALSVARRGVGANTSAPISLAASDMALTSVRLQATPVGDGCKGQRHDRNLTSLDSPVKRDEGGQVL